MKINARYHRARQTGPSRDEKWMRVDGIPPPPPPSLLSLSVISHFVFPQTRLNLFTWSWFYKRRFERDSSVNVSGNVLVLTFIAENPDTDSIIFFHKYVKLRQLLDMAGWVKNTDSCYTVSFHNAKGMSYGSERNKHVLKPIWNLVGKAYRTSVIDPGFLSKNIFSRWIRPYTVQLVYPYSFAASVEGLQTFTNIAVIPPVSVGLSTAFFQ